MRLLAMQTLPICAFGLFFGGFAAFWITGSAAGASHSNHGDPMGQVFNFFPLFGLPFLFIGLGMILSPVFAYFTAKKTV